jgi:predicted acylesterase/phospholipase RssA
MASRAAIVLSGGGAKGDFEVGAVRALYDLGVVPRILVGTSVGALNAVKLAEGEDPADPTRGLPGLERIWSGLRVDEDMSVPAAWLSDPDLDPAVVAALTGTGEFGNIGATAPAPPLPGDTSPAVVSYFFNAAGWLFTDGRKLLESLKKISQATHIFSLDPIRPRLRTSLDPAKVAEWGQRGGRLALATVSMDSGRLRYVTETGALLERDLSTPVSDRGKVAPECQPLADKIAGLDTQIRDLQKDLADAGDKATVTRAINRLRFQQRQLLEDLAACGARHPVPAVVELPAAALASAAIPVVFGLEQLAGELYADGGVREVIPIQAAVTLGADEVWAVSASTIGVAPASYQGATMADLSARVLDLFLGEIVADDLRPTGGAPVRLIAPDLEVHGLRTIDPGLMQINRDYGYMRAADVFGGAQVGGQLWTSATEIARARIEIWERENTQVGQGDARYPGRPAPAADPSMAPRTAELKAALGVLLDARRALGGKMPADVDRWRTELERHRWSPPDLDTLAAEFVSQTLPFDAATGQTRQVAVTMRNTGQQTWTSGRGFKLGALETADWGTARVALPNAVPPGGQVTFTFQITAPSLPAAYGWQMLQEGVTWFGDTTPRAVIAAPDTPVRFGAQLALRHHATGRALHSHQVNYTHPGTSGQQQVTCYAGLDANNEWLVKPAHGQPAGSRAGNPVAHGDIVRLEHVGTRRNLHSHTGFPSPLTGQQEVTCFGEKGIGDGNDDWRVEVESGGVWSAGSRVRLIHVPTNVALHSHQGHADPTLTSGQQEVTGYAGRDFNDWWSASDLRAHDARFVSQVVPQSIVAGQPADVSVTMANTGTRVWTPQDRYRLGSQQPQDNLTWAIGRIEVPHVVAPGEQVTLAFRITAPTAYGPTPFQWKMLQEGVEWFGDLTSPVQVLVAHDSGPTTVPDVGGLPRVPAAQAIRAADLIPRHLGSSAAAAEVRQQSPAAGDVVPRGTTVTLTMSSTV